MAYPEYNNPWAKGGTHWEKSAVHENVFNEDSLIAELEDLRNILHNSLNLFVAAYQENMEALRPVLYFKLDVLSINFSKAWENHRAILTEAKEDAESENTVRSVIIGAAASVVVAAAIELAIAAAAAELVAFSTGWWATQTGGALASSIGGAAVSEKFLVETDFRPIIPQEFQRINALKQLLEFERIAARVHLAASNIGKKLSILEVVIDEMKSGRAHDVRKEADDFIRRRKDIESLPSKWINSTEIIKQFRNHVADFQLAPVKTIEQSIWIHWIASLNPSEEHDKLDSDAIEDYLHGAINILGENSLLNVDTREVFDTDKEKEAINKAQALKGNLKEMLTV